MKRPQVIRFAAFVTVLAVLLGYVVYHRTSPDTAVTARGGVTAKVQQNTTNLENYFVNFRMKRDQLMSKEIATLQALIKNSGISKAAKAQASATLVRDTQELKQETRIEGLLSGRGFPLSAATVAGNQVVVQVGAARLTQKQVARIADTATMVTGLPPQDVVILPKS
ncbi:SpoIIIAH-like family protein [Sulfobacillus harzensis]|uniref:SpoIIIAH-like family protein n=1 Tax=Sulfobacillus harzensis TaxID=2729629 RepID=A0A7Y0Q1B5_9FIRM|nr:SpoIIIAH-like family protein [Sulfobacillus harzensis]NMP21155.1 SpoIIIAH-like family protein [Sulfobacillus harzensis]